MNRHISLLVLVVSATALSGCYIHEQANAEVYFEGDISTDSSAFRMEGVVWISGEFQRDRYENISMEFYDASGELLHREQVGTVYNTSQRFNISVSLQTVPEYIIFDSPDLWDGDTTVKYFVRTEDGSAEYERGETNNRDDLPIPPDG